MIIKIIENKINSLTINDIKELSIKEDIELNNSEINIIYKCIKNDYKELLFGNSELIFKQLKNQINLNSYNKIKTLFDFYKNKYKNYL